MPDYMEIEKLVIKPGEGRFINGLDVKEKNKIIILDRKIAKPSSREKSRWENI